MPSGVLDALAVDFRQEPLDVVPLERRHLPHLHFGRSIYQNP
ncbi:MAG: hypothetical protein AAGJ97_06175 [Planctomycetota bacterium]